MSNNEEFCPEDFIVCECCGNKIIPTVSFITVTGGYICFSCSGNYEYCSDCGRMGLHKEFTITNEDRMLCDYCMGEYGEDLY